MKHPYTRGSRPPNGRASVLTIALLAALPAAATGTNDALTAPLHGGTVTETDTHTFETTVAGDGVHIWFFTDERAPAMAGRATGTATLKLPDGQTREVPLAVRTPTAGGPGVYFCPMHAEVVRKAPGRCEPCGGMILFHQDELFGAVDLTGLELPDLAAITAQIRLTGLQGRSHEAAFSPAFSLPDGKVTSHGTGK